MDDSDDTPQSEDEEIIEPVEGAADIKKIRRLFNQNPESKMMNECPPDMKRAHRRHSLCDNSAIFNPVQSQKIQRRHCNSLQRSQSLHGSLIAANNLPDNQYMNRTSDSPPSYVAGVGSELFIAFLHEEINRSHLNAPKCLTSSRLSSHRNSDSSYEFLSLGAHLRLMADEFACSDHRRRVREQAENIPLESLDADSFTDLLFGMFQRGGVTWERILVLFVFCTDLAVRALREHLSGCFANLMHWSQLYIESWLTPWVQRHGGWAVILERSVNEAYKAAMVGACMVGMLALWTYIRSVGH